MDVCDGDARKQVILVVDDTPDNLTLMNELLKDLYKVKLANGGERALRIASSDSPPDLILLDIMMPETDGYEVCIRLKADPKTRDIPVIQGCTIYIAVVFVVANLIIDLLYGLLDPRVRVAKEA